MKDVALAQGRQQIDTAVAAVNRYGRDIFENFDLVEERFLGDKSRVPEARKLVADWKAIRSEVIAHMNANEREEAAAITKV